MNYVDISNDNDNTGSTLPSSSDVFGNGTSSNDLLQNSKVLNVMLFGEDNNHGDKYGRTDTMIMLSIDNIHKKIKLTSFQRDTYVYIPGNGYDKINASYTLGGAKLSIQTIEANFGIKIDRYAVVDFESFIKIIDTLGGIDMEVTQDEIDYINYQMYKNDQTDTATTITDAPGNVHLNGQEALWYARDRGLTKGEDDNEIGIDGDDWDRTSRQRKLLETLFDSMKSADLGQIVSIVSSIGPLITTNLKKDEITALVSNALTYLKYDVEQYYVPEEGLWYYDDDTPSGSVIRIADMEKQRIAFAKFIYEVGDSSSNNGNAQTTTSSN
jgi:LCP family protein required for cell wall assembly